jgi:methyl-accepting chemotaxis protein
MIDSGKIEKQLDFFGLEFGHNDRLPLILDGIDRHAGAALDILYTQIGSDPALAAKFGNASMMRHAREKQLEHWRGLFSTGIDTDFLQNAERIGRVHARIGLEPVWYVGAYALVLDHIVDGIVNQSARRRLLRGKALARAIGTLVKSALFDMQLAISTYFDVANRERAAVIERVGSALAALADGDVTAQLTGLGPEYSQIEKDYEVMRLRMSGTLTEVAEAAEMIRTSSAEIADASGNLAQRTEQQAAGVQQTAAAMEQLTVSVHDTARDATEARRSVDIAGNDAEAGGVIVNQAVGAMAEIERSSAEISQIITVIDGIAFQTNLLALNAGVEAARAGDAGMGFAVVAAEVRALAQRTADAAKNITQLITASSTQVRAGVELVGQTGDALQRIATRISDVDALVAAIATASDGQATGIAEINAAVGSMDRGIQQNAAMVEESTAAARSLASESDRLAELVGHFKIQARADMERIAQRASGRPRRRAA